MAQIDHQLLMALMDTIPDRIYFKDRDGHFLSVNQAMREFLKAPTEEAFKGKTDFDFFLPEHAKEAFSDDRRTDRGQTGAGNSARRADRLGLDHEGPDAGRRGENHRHMRDFP
jgi:PAS domain-containing protein